MVFMLRRNKIDYTMNSMIFLIAPLSNSVLFAKSSQDLFSYSNLLNRNTHKKKVTVLCAKRVGGLQQRALHREQ